MSKGTRAIHLRFSTSIIWVQVHTNLSSQLVPLANAYRSFESCGSFIPPARKKSKFESRFKSESNFESGGVGIARTMYSGAFLASLSVRREEEREVGGDRR